MLNSEGILQEVTKLAAKLLKKINIGGTDMTQSENFKIATFAGGCFWCMIPPFQKLNGVKSVIAGYMGGNTCNPSYKDVCTGKTGHYEVVQIEYDPELISYEELVETFWKQINPVDPGGQF